MRPRLLDLFCCAGGAGMGYHRAGFDVTGVDIKPQPHYPFAFVQADALEYLREHGHEYDAIHASPPCQAHTALKTMPNAREHISLIEPCRELLIASGKPYVMENVPGSPLKATLMLCGTMFGLGVDGADLIRHRYFETSFDVDLVPCCQHGRRAIGVYGGHVRDRRRTIGVYGKGARDSRCKTDKGCPDFTTEQGKRAMGIDWMSVTELSQAIPPAYTEFIGKQLLEAIR